MPNNGRSKRYCKVCGRHRDECGQLSARGKCWDCGGANMLRNANQLREHRGPFFDHWLERTRRAFGLVPVDTGTSAE